MDKINQRIAAELGVGVPQVAAVVALLGEGSTVPFIARYRKETTRSSGSWRSGWATCASWRTAGRPC